MYKNFKEEIQIFTKEKKEVRRGTLEIGLNMINIHGTHVSNSQRINKNIE